ncbi:ABC transporter permease [Anaerolineae bacterium CFX9]|nr:ABC transporter permease [Anaerolineae bacterium CFX9]
MTAVFGMPGSLRHLASRAARNHLVNSLLRSILVALGISIIAFTIIRLIPGDPAQIALGDQASEQDIAQYRTLLGIDGSLAEQFVRYMSGLLRGDLGISLTSRQPVLMVIERRLPATLWLIGVTSVMALVLATPLGIAAALYRRTWFDQVFRIGASILLATPTFFSAVVAILFFSINLGLAPVAGYRPTFPENLRYLWLPAFVLCGVLVPVLARVLQSSISDTLEQEFIETAIVRGLPRRVFFWRYLLRPSLGPTITLLGYIVGALLGAAVILEMVFNIPGIGTALIEAVLNRDYTMVQGIVFTFGVLVVFVSFISEIAVNALDPRTR